MRFSKYFADFVAKQSLVTLTLVAVLLLFSLLNIHKFKLDASSDSLVLENDDDLRYYRSVSKKYNSSDFLIVLFTPKASLFSKEVIKKVRNLNNEFNEIEGIASTLSYLDVPLLFSPVLPIRELADNLRTIESEGVDLDLVKKEFTSSPLYSELLVSANGKTTGMQLFLPKTPVYDNAIDDRYKIRQALKASKESDSDDLLIRLEEVNEVIRKSNDLRTLKRDKLINEVRQVMQNNADAGQLYLGGTAMIASDMLSFISADLLFFGIGVAILFLITLGIVFRKARWVFLPLVCSGMVGTFILGFLGWMDWRVTVVSSNFIALLLIITISLTMHLIVRYQELASKHIKLPQKELVALTVQQMLKPCLYTALTTMVAFASLSVSEIKPVVDFGIMMVVGIFFAFLFAFTALPAFISLLPKLDSDSQKDFTRGLTLIFSSAVEKYGRLVLVISSLLIIFALAGINKLTVENRFIDYFKSSTEIYRGMELLDKELGGTAPLDIILKAPNDFLAQEADQNFDDDFEETSEERNGYWWNINSIKRLEKVHDYLDSLPEIGKVLSVASGIKVAEKLNDDKPLSELDLALVKNMLPEDIKATLLNSYISKDENEVRISSRVLETSRGLKRNELLITIKKELENNFGFNQDEYRITGLAVLYNNMLQSLFNSQIGTLEIVFGVIMLMFLVLFKSWKLAILGMVPNLLAAGVVLGSMGWMGIPLDIMTITVAAISVGMAVDNTIHYIHRFKIEFYESGNYHQAMLNSHATIGRAMFYTSMTIIIGFLVLVTSNFNPTAYFGFFVSLAMVMALMGALTLLPKLILVLRPLGPEINKGGGINGTT